ncbi:hypothetical protein IEQ34_006389 [Dendrobium chrysotoxum]|uniref:Uncharacterized protein n=1 Tax=Dendrobium chrysotoxum TaxID=161865 RepID=A0AAV7HBK5_DENCH|nr:hypothetical protein IEQ34_006389 [Dendrobium chrysotoxum]
MGKDFNLVVDLVGRRRDWTARWAFNGDGSAGAEDGFVHGAVAAAAEEGGLGEVLGGGFQLPVGEIPDARMGVRCGSREAFSNISFVVVACIVSPRRARALGILRLIAMRLEDRGERGNGATGANRGIGSA